MRVHTYAVIGLLCLMYTFTSCYMTIPSRENGRCEELFNIKTLDTDLGLYCTAGYVGNCEALRLTRVIIQQFLCSYV
ncbi:hypothetical protein B0T25DRAFT_544131 [Lasiosphaeria hispida]|uniref:Uncharacterized protein n=1 Tax=Lasiosphaeria hispida TaxID=260671 RepID=A0AAJ0HIE7_9PEZI|nr:hypothetical protein B0T25DRAFT_544131 [Lasiosphaeria hispida]